LGGGRCCHNSILGPPDWVVKAESKVFCSPQRPSAELEVCWHTSQILLLLNPP
jgi:hypothetical protein